MMNIRNRFARWSLVVWVFAVGLLLLAECAAGQAAWGQGGQPRQRPNIVLIMADDLGYGELGSYGQEKIQTPNLDRLAAEGLRFTQFYSGSPVCAPSRATLLTGRHTGHTYVRSNFEMGGFGEDVESGQLPLMPGTRTMATMLQEAGYATGAMGKWGLGGPPVGDEEPRGLPWQHGFDLFYGYLDQKQAHNYYPTYLWRVTPGAMVKDTLRNDYLYPHGQELEAPPGDPAFYEKFKGKDYTPDLMQTEALRFIRQHREERFFLYLPSPLPHVSLQVPDEELAAYDFEETPYLAREGYLPHPRPRAAYAGMISRLDRYVGQVMDLIDELGLKENTLVLFTSDNGPSYAGGVQPAFFESAGGLRGLKGSVYEGGIRVPMIARWPGRIGAGRTTERPAALWDLLPTVAELTGAVPLDSIDGVSLAPTLLGREGRQKEHEHLYWEYFGPCNGQQALRMGPWKGVRIGVRDSTDAPIELYNLADDPDESRNVAAEHPEVVRRVWRHMQKAHTPPAFERWEIPRPEQPPGPAKNAGKHPCFPWVEGG